MRRVLIATATLTASAAFAQAPEDPPARDFDELEALSRIDSADELDALSRSGDNPFAGVIDVVKREPVSVTLRALDKITARYTDIEIRLNEIAEFGSLELLPRYCDKRPPEEFPETTVFLEVFDREFGARGDDLKIDPALLDTADGAAPPAGDRVDAPLDLEDIPAFGDAAAAEAGPVEAVLAPETSAPAQPAPEVLNGPQADGKNIFRGWMFASSPALNALEHPVYDVWVIDCKTRVIDN